MEKLNISGPVISIITVVYNSLELFRRTFNSIVSQDYANLEYIVVDGNSSDGTAEFIKEHNNKITRWVSEPDNGIYYAMNKGLDMAEGNYLWFINAGDTLPSPTTVSDMVNTLNRGDLPQIIYGETMITDGSGNITGSRRKKAPEKLSWKSFRYGMMVCHQSVLISPDVAGKFDTSYRISADFGWVLDALKKSSNIHNSGMVLSFYMEDGFSKRNVKPSLRERAKIMASHYGWLPTIWYHIVITLRFILYYSL